MGAPIDITGQRYGKLVALSLTDEFEYNNRKWLFQCDCGKQVKIATGRVRRKQGFKSCGCAQWACIEPLGLMGLVKYYKNNARVRNLEWALSIDDCRDLLFGNCFYCGTAPATEYTYSYKGAKNPAKLLRNGIDRACNDLGYVKDNCVTCCSECNYMKRTMTQEHFLELVKKIYSNWYSS